MKEGVKRFLSPSFYSREWQLFLLSLSSSKKYKADSKFEVLYENSARVCDSEKICFFSHFSETNTVAPYVFYYLRSLNELGFSVVFCTTSEHLNEESVNQLKALCDFVIQRENIGFDFGSWKTCWRLLKAKTQSSLKDKKQLLLANDSVWGPFFSLENIINKMDENGNDFWGLTENHFPRYHLQSYFLLFNSRPLKQGVLDKLFESIRFFEDKKQVIVKYELKWTQKLLNNGYSAGVAFPVDQDFAGSEENQGFRKRIKYCDPTILLWDQLIKKRQYPFLKRSVVRYNPQDVLSLASPKDLLKQVSDYPTEYIEAPR